MPLLRKAPCLILVLGFLGCLGPDTTLQPGKDLVEGLRFARVTPGTDGLEAPEIIDERGGRLFIPYGTRVDYHLRLEPGSSLRIERLAFSDEASGRLEVRIATDANGEETLAEVSEPGAELDLGLSGDAPRAARVSLTAASELGPGPRRGVVLTRPAIWRPAPPAREIRQEPQAPFSPNAPFEPSRTPNILIYLVDTLRPDHLGAYGYSRPTSPHFDRFAARAHLFEYAVGQSPWTRPSVASIFTGMTPMAHGTVSKKTKLDAELPALADILASSGYATAAVFSNPNVSATFGFDRGFAEVFTASDRANAATQKAMAWLAEYEGGRPFFLYVHTSEPHQPYLASPPFRERFAPDADEIVEVFERNPQRQIWPPTDENRRRLKNLYDAEIAEMDTSFGELIGMLESRELLDPALVLYVSDHGEEFYEHKRWGHGRSLAVEQLNVALAVKFPAQNEGSRIADVVQHIDIMPTILDYLGLPIPPTVEGRSLATLNEEGGDPALDPEAEIFSHNIGGRQYGVIVGDYKLTRRQRQGKVKLKGLYNWRRDPRELENLLAERPILAAVLDTTIERQRARFESVRGQDAVLDDRIRDELRALGYLQ